MALALARLTDGGVPHRHEVPGDVPRGQAEAAQGTDGDVGEVLADTGALGPGVLTAAVHAGAARHVAHLGTHQGGELLGSRAGGLPAAHGIHQLGDAVTGAGARRQHQPLVAAVLHGRVAHSRPVERRGVPGDVGALDGGDGLDLELTVAGQALHRHDVGAPVVAVDVAPRHRADPDAVLEGGLAGLVDRGHPQLVVGGTNLAVIGQGGRVDDSPAAHVRPPRPGSTS